MFSNEILVIGCKWVTIFKLGWHDECKIASSDSMISHPHKHRWLAVAIFAFGTVICSAQSAGGAPAGGAGDAAAKARAEASKSREQANAQRDRMIAEYEALVKQLKDATEAQKKVILEKMQERKKAFEEAQNTLHQQIRDEQRRQRQNAAPKR